MSKHETMGDALAGAMQLIKRLEKDQRNDYAEYDYAGIEAFVDMARHALQENGVFITQGMVAHQMTEKHLVAKFEFYVHWGNDHFGPVLGEAAAPSKMGPQAFGAAGSYALKFFVRTLLMMSSDKGGEVDETEPSPLQDPNAKPPTITPATEKKLRKAIADTESQTEDSGIMQRILDGYRIETLGDLPRDFEAGVASRLKDMVAVYQRKVDGNQKVDTAVTELAAELAGDDGPKLLAKLTEYLGKDGQEPSPPIVLHALQDMQDNPDSDLSVDGLLGAES